MTTRSTAETSVKSAGTTLVNSVISAEEVRQVSMDASNSVVGYNLQTGNNAALLSAIKSANAAKAASLLAAEVARQATLDAARETLRANSDYGPL